MSKIELVAIYWIIGTSILRGCYLLARQFLGTSWVFGLRYY